MGVIRDTFNALFKGKIFNTEINQYKLKEQYEEALETRSRTSTAIGSLEDAKEDKSNKGQINGYPSLDADGKVPSTQIGDISGNSPTATKLITARKIGIATGDIESAGSDFDGSADNSNVYTIKNNIITNEKLSDMPINTIKASLLGGDPQDITLSNMKIAMNTDKVDNTSDIDKMTVVEYTELNTVDKTIIGSINETIVTDSTINGNIKIAGAENEVYRHPNHSGDVTSTGDGVTVISTNVVTNNKLSQMPTKTFKGNKESITGNAQDLTITDAQTMIFSDDGHLPVSLTEKNQWNNASSPVKIYNTIVEMQANSVNISEGMIIELLGYYEKGDGGGHRRKKNHVGMTYEWEILTENGMYCANWFGLSENNVDNTSFLQEALDYAKYKNESIVYCNTGDYIFLDTVNIYAGYKFYCGNVAQVIKASYSYIAKGVRFLFNPTSLKPFVKSNLNVEDGSFLTNVLFGGLKIEANSNCSYIFDLTKTIYSTFSNMGVSGGEIHFKNSGTISNNFVNILSNQAEIKSIEYSTVATTDVWDKCTFNSMPVVSGFVNCVNIRFSNCLFEQIKNNLAIIDSLSQNITFSDCYGEDLNFDSTVSTNSVFKVGVGGSSYVNTPSLIVNGGKYGGKNVGLNGKFLEVDYTKSIMLNNCSIARYTDFMSFTANTKDGCVHISGLEWLSITSFPTTVYPKLNGSFNGGDTASASKVFSKSDRVITGWLGNDDASIIQVHSNLILNGSTHYTSTDNVVSNGRASNRWSVVYAGTGTINTSDDREKTYLDISEKETLIAKELKLLMKKFKFNNSIEEKGLEVARIHFGTSAQSVKLVFEKYELNAFDYALLCYDEWEDERDEEGNIVKIAGNRYGIRYEELLCFIISAI